MGKRTGPDNQVNGKLDFSCFLINPLTLSTVPKDYGWLGMWSFQEMLRGSDTSSMTLEVKAGPLFGLSVECLTKE